MASSKGTKGSKSRKGTKGSKGSKGGTRAPGTSKIGTTKFTPLSGSKLRPPEHVMYGVAIREAIARGNMAEMRRIAAQARTHIADVQKALQQLERKLG